MTISTGEVKYANGGHNRPYVLRTNGRLEMLPKIPGIALGAMGNMPYAGESLQLNTGDILIMYTDGVTEAMNRPGELFGETRFEKVLENTSEKSAKELTKIILAAIHQHVKDAEQSDDITILAIKYERL